MILTTDGENYPARDGILGPELRIDGKQAHASGRILSVNGRGWTSHPAFRGLGGGSGMARSDVVSLRARREGSTAWRGELRGRGFHRARLRRFLFRYRERSSSVGVATRRWKKRPSHDGRSKADCTDATSYAHRRSARSEPGDPEDRGDLEREVVDVSAPMPCPGHSCATPPRVRPGLRTDAFRRDRSHAEHELFREWLDSTPTVRRVREPRTHTSVEGCSRGRVLIDLPQAGPQPDRDEGRVDAEKLLETGTRRRLRGGNLRSQRDVLARGVDRRAHVPDDREEKRWPTSEM